jgi:hypothetical protein
VLLALTAAVALLAAGCPGTTGEFVREDFSKSNPWPGSSIIVGQNVVVRLSSRSWHDADMLAALYLDVFPVGAVLRGAWVQMVRRGQVYEGPAKVWRSRSEQSYDVLGPDFLEPRARAERDGPDSTTVWLGPVCVADACETVVVRDGDWPPTEWER